MWYSPHDILSHNALFNFVIGNRGAGKTYSAKKWAIKGFLKNKSQFIYLRRYKTEFDDFQNFFSDIMHEFPDTEFSVNGKTLKINGEVAGYGVPLSTALTKKSVSYHKVDKIIFDEFVIDSKVIHYLNNEVNHFLEFYETVARMRDNVRALFLSNAVSVVNPYFLYWNIRPSDKRRFSKYGHMIVEFVKNEAFINAKYQTRFGQIIKDTKYGDYAVENVYLKDNMNFVEKKSGNAKFEFSILFNGKQYGFWHDFRQGIIYVSEDIDPSNSIVYSLMDEEHQPNILLIKNANRSPFLKTAILAYESGCVRFESLQVKNQCIEIFNLLRS